MMMLTAPDLIVVASTVLVAFARFVSATRTLHAALFVGPTVAGAVIVAVPPLTEVTTRVELTGACLEPAGLTASSGSRMAGAPRERLRRWRSARRTSCAAVGIPCDDRPKKRCTHRPPPTAATRSVRHVR